MSIPKRIQELADEADRIQAQLSGDDLQEPVQPTTAEPVQGADGVQPVAEQVTPAQAQATSIPIEASGDEVTWERRFRTIQGKYDAEVPRLSSDLRTLQERLATVTAEMDRIKAQKTEAPKPKTPLVTDKDTEAFGSDLIDLIDRKAREVADALVDARVGTLEGENQKLRDQLGGVSERQASNDREAYFAKLAAQVPDFEALNVDQGFMDWLADKDPLSGFPRQEYLNKAWAAFDAAHTATLFNAYKQLKAPASPAPVTPAPQDPVSQAKQQLQRQVAPNKSKLSADPTSSTPTKVWTTQDIERFYADVRRGVYHGKEDLRVQVESEIDQAVAQGRVR